MMSLMNIKLVRSACSNDTNSVTKMSPACKKSQNKRAHLSARCRFFPKNRPIQALNSMARKLLNVFVPLLFCILNLRSFT